MSRIERPDLKRPERARALTGVEDLIREGLAPEAARADLARVAEGFRIRISPAMATNPAPGVRDQFLPDPREMQILPEELADPIGDAVHRPRLGPHGAAVEGASAGDMAGGQAETEPAPPSQAEGPVPGLTHRYPDRVILHATQTCEVYCRFCFRREAVGEGGALAEAEFLRVLAYLSDHPEIWEVILTGGDPLVLSPRRIGDMLARLARIGSVKVIRFHSRIPVVAPERITPALIAALNGPRGGMAGEGAQGAARGDSGNGMARAGEGGPEAAASLIATPAPAADSERETSAPSPAWPAVWMVVHTNHPDEITPRAGAALSMLVEAGIPVLSQSVLLRGINADPDVLEALFRRLIAHRVKPYYLHHPDLAKGTGHFRLPLAEGRRIFAALRGRISGTALPTYVLDIPGGHGKVPVNADYLEPLGHDGLGPGDWIVTDPKGHRHRYRDL